MSISIDWKKIKVECENKNCDGSLNYDLILNKKISDFFSILGFVNIENTKPQRKVS